MRRYCAFDLAISWCSVTTMGIEAAAVKWLGLLLMTGDRRMTRQLEVCRLEVGASLGMPDPSCAPKNVLLCDG